MAVFHNAVPGYPEQLQQPAVNFIDTKPGYIH